LIAVACSGAPVQAQTTLRYKFKQGEKLNYLMEQKNVMKMNVMGQEFPIDLNLTFDLSWTVTGVDANGSAQITQKFERIRFLMDNAILGKSSFDSKDGKDAEGLVGQQLGPIFKAMAGAEVTMTMNPQGEPKDVKLSDKVLQALKNFPAAAQLGGDIFSEDGLKQMMNLSGLVLPAEAISKGKTWQQSIETKSALGKMKVNNVCTYEGSTTQGGKQLEQIAFKPKLDVELDPKSIIKKFMLVDAKGSALFDNATGRLVETTMKQSMDMEVNFGGQLIKQAVETTTNMKLVP
jgi:hypothetical protein